MSLYLWIKVVHILAVISWMAGLLYLPRLFVYHTASGSDGPTAETFKIMEARLLRGIMNPAMIISWAAGIGMIAVNPGLLSSGGWLHAKLLLVVLMTGAHMYFARCRRLIAAGANPHSERFYRITNEVPAVLMVGIVIMVIIKPF
ncbi:MAG: protoporphyrinogen oxidase HemJ [Pseudomonadota bacterium]